MAAFAGIVLFETPGLIQKKYWRELIVFFMFLLLAFIVSLLQIFGAKVPNPVKGITILVKGFLSLMK
jgi:hypothetical protein